MTRTATWAPVRCSRPWSFPSVRSRLAAAHAGDDPRGDGVPLRLAHAGVDPGVGEDDDPALEEREEEEDARAGACPEELLLDEGGRRPLMDAMLDRVRRDQPDP